MIERHGWHSFAGHGLHRQAADKLVEGTTRDHGVAILWGRAMLQRTTPQHSSRSPLARGNGASALQRVWTVASYMSTSGDLWWVLQSLYHLAGVLDSGHGALKRCHRQ